MRGVLEKNRDAPLKHIKQKLVAEAKKILNEDGLKCHKCQKERQEATKR
jgi:hypothetical protein